MLLGYSQGGIYRTDDGGQNWVPVFDDQPSLSIAHIVFDPHDPSHMWAATGDVNISGYYWLGVGVYESNDTGLTWHYKGLDDTGVLSKIAVDPNDPDILYVGSMGYPAQPGNQKGFFRSTDGGDTWQKTLHIDDSTGIIDLVTDPIKPGRVFATSWTRIRSNTKGLTVGPGTGVYKSEDYGATWINLTNGLPEGVHSRTSVEITNDGTLFVSYVGNHESIDCGIITEDLRNVFKSDDSGQTWDTIPTSIFHGLPCVVMGGFGWYFEALKVNPENPLDMCLLGVSMFRTLDGGQSWFESTTDWPVNVHADKHDLVYAHGQLFLGTDGGAYSVDINQTTDWIDIEDIPSTQYYRTTWNPHIPDFYYGGAQDNGTSGGNGTLFSEWLHLFGGDGFQPLFDPTEPDWMFALTQNGNVWFSQDGGFDFNWFSQGLEGARYWDMPLVMSAHNPKKLYCGSYKMFKIDMLDPERIWTEFSPDLTRGDTILGSRYPAITAIAESELDSNRLYAGTQDGLVWTTADGGLNWTNITEGTPGFFVTSLTCSAVNPEGVIATYSGYRDNDHQPYIYRSDDAGKTWEPVQSDLPMMGVNNLFILPGWDDAVLIIGTDGGVYATFDAGLEWQRVGGNMPYMPVYDIDYNPVEDKIIAATFSRGIMTFPVAELDIVSAVDEPAVTLHADQITVYPTIASDYFIVDFENYNEESENFEIKVLDVSGQIMQRQTFGIEDQTTVKVTLKKDLSTGIYFVVISNGNESIGKVVLLQ
jgi:photosystem II stability/assembly factor-like uncharacterized protein